MIKRASKQRVLITGATGGLGLALVDLFVHSAYHVTATGRASSHIDRFKSLGVDFLPMDLCETENLQQLCSRQDTIIHAAALSSSWDTPEKFEAINVIATENLLQAAQLSGCTQFIFISSPSIYAAMRERPNLSEDDLPARKPLNHYAQTKLRAEHIVLAADKEGFNTSAIRPRAIVGPNDTVLLPKLMEMMDRKSVPLLRQGRALIELTDVRDVAQAVLLVERHMALVKGETINISSGRPIAVRDLATRLACALDRPIKFLHLPMALARSIAWLSEWWGKKQGYETEPKLTRYKLATMAYSQTFDLKKAHDKLGFTPYYDGVTTLIEAARERFK